MAEEESGTDDGEIRGTLFIDKRIEAYQAAFVNPLGKRLGQAADGLTIERAVSDLKAGWRMADLSRSMAWLLVQSIQGFVSEGFQAGVRSHAGAVELVVKKKRKKVSERIHRLLKHASQEALSAAGQTKEVLANERVIHERAQADFDDLIKTPQFAMSLQASESQAFISFYFEYENFLARVIEARTGEFPDKTWKLVEALKKEFGKEAKKSLWDDPLVAAARHVRDAKVHRGLQANEDTPLESSLIHVQDGCIKIAAKHNHELFPCLYEKALEVIELHRADPVAQE